MEFDHTILWSHYVWTDPVSRRSARVLEPPNGWQNYDPEAWVDEGADAFAVTEESPPKCRRGEAKTRFTGPCRHDARHSAGALQAIGPEAWVDKVAVASVFEDPHRSARRAGHRPALRRRRPLASQAAQGHRTLGRSLRAGGPAGPSRRGSGSRRSVRALTPSNGCRSTARRLGSTGSPAPPSSGTFT